MNEELRKRAEEFLGDGPQILIYPEDRLIHDLFCALKAEEKKHKEIWEAACRAQQLQDAAFVTLSLDWKQAWLAPMPEDDLSQPPDLIVADPGNLKE